MPSSMPSFCAVASRELVDARREHDEREVDLEDEQREALQFRREAARVLEQQHRDAQPVRDEPRRAHPAQHASPPHLDEEIAAQQDVDERRATTARPSTSAMPAASHTAMSTGRTTGFWTRSVDVRSRRSRPSARSGRTGARAGSAATSVAVSSNPYADRMKSRAAGPMEGWKSGSEPSQAFIAPGESDPNAAWQVADLSRAAEAATVAGDPRHRHAGRWRRRRAGRRTAEGATSAEARASIA